MVGGWIGGDEGDEKRGREQEVRQTDPANRLGLER
jgi:hypothetical protein